MFKYFSLSIVAMVMLAACQAEASPKPSRQEVSGNDMLYSCSNGLSVRIRQLDEARIELRLDDKQAVLYAATSGSGERYVGESGLFGSGAEWHQKRGQAMFSFVDPYGNAVETNCQAKS